MRAKNCDSCKYFKLIYKYGYRFFYSLQFHLRYCAYADIMKVNGIACENYRRELFQDFDITCERWDEAEGDVKALLELLEDFT